jgi:hypothetical protein
MKIFAISAALLCGSCVAADSPCVSAVNRVNQCVGGTVLTPSTQCDPEAAARILATDCATLQATAGERRIDSFGDPFGAIACALGIIRYCPVPACTAPSYPDGGRVCSDYIAVPGCGGCQYYVCRDAESSNPCGADGYALKYGYKYCSRFTETTRPRLSAAGQRFIDATRDCLMHYIDQQIPDGVSCDDFRQRAYASHVLCYRDSGFCTLPPEDQLEVISTIDLADLDLTTALKAGLACVQ